MEGRESVLDGIFEEENINMDDVDMIDIEEGELVERTSQMQIGQSSAGELKTENQENCKKTRKRSNKKKRNKKNKGNPGPNITDINRFVTDVCKRLREKKSYLIWTAVSCLGVSALSDLVKEVDAIQVCGGQKTVDGKRYRTGGGILWGILKEKDPNAYKEIMKKGYEFEKGFTKHIKKQTPAQPCRSTNHGGILKNEFAANKLEERSDETLGHELSQSEPPGLESKCGSVYERIRIPVAYDDDILKPVKDLKI